MKRAAAAVIAAALVWAIYVVTMAAPFDWKPLREGTLWFHAIVAPPMVVAAVLASRRAAGGVTGRLFPLGPILAGIGAFLLVAVVMAFVAALAVSSSCESDSWRCLGFLVILLGAGASLAGVAGVIIWNRLTRRADRRSPAPPDHG